VWLEKEKLNNNFSHVVPKMYGSIQSSPDLNTS